jgi:hypothetical protein
MAAVLGQICVWPAGDGQTVAADAVAGLIDTSASGPLIPRRHRREYLTESVLLAARLLWHRRLAEGLTAQRRDSPLECDTP